MRRSLVLGLLVACHPPAAAPTPPASAAPEPLDVDLSEVLVDTPPRPNACVDHDDVFMTAEDVTLHCEDGHRQCRGVTKLRVRNCTNATVRLRVVRLVDGDFVKLFEPADGTLPPADAWTHENTFSRAGRFTVQAELGHGDETFRTEPVTLQVQNPARDAALAACEVCKGHWGRHGMAGLEGCNCATTDAGVACDDGEDCQGACLFERFEVVRPASRTCGDDGGCTVQLALGRPIGKCSSHRMVFGCHARIDAGASKEDPVPLPWRAPTTCVD